MRSNVAASICGGLEGSLYRPPFIYSVANGVWEDVKLSSPFGNSVRISVVGDKPIVSFIAKLRFMASPTAIFRGIRTIIVYAVKRPVWWASPHVMIKLFEGFAPRFTDGNSSPTVPTIVNREGISAASLHSLPNSVLPSTARSVMCDFTDAPTRMTTVAFQVIRLASNYVSTVADAEPGHIFSSVFTNGSYSKKLSEYLKRQIVSFFADVYNCIRHFGISSIECLGGRGRLPSPANYT
jgi:hypothetical protein